MPRPERPLDHENGVLPEFAAGLRKLRQQAGKPTYRELAKSAHYSVTVLAEAAGGRKLPSLAVTLAYVKACGGNEEEWRRRWQDIAAEQSPVPEQDAPYVGLGAFQSGDANKFFGREKLVRQLLAKLDDHRVVGVFGASGSGKSSVLRAGLLPRVPGAKLIAPGAHPRVPDAELLIVDQFEEVFTLCRDPGERAEFIGDLLRRRVVVGVRSDFHAHCCQHPGLVDALNDAQVIVGAMSADELHEAITQPAPATRSRARWCPRSPPSRRRCHWCRTCCWRRGGAGAARGSRSRATPRRAASSTRSRRAPKPSTPRSNRTSGRSPSGS